MNPYLLMWLEGPLQSWGVESRYGKRNTLSFPTRSGVMGILCAAMGAGGTQCDLLADFAKTDMQVIAFHTASRHTVTHLEDFQMVGAGYDESSAWQALFIPKTQEGKKAVGGGVKLTYRSYLQDSCFAVFLELPQQYVTAVSAALQAPIWDLSLGRKNCVPTEFIYQGVFEELKQAHQRAQQLSYAKNLLYAFKVLQGTIPNADRIITLNDIPLQFGEQKRYRDRQVSLFYAKE